MNTEEKIKSLQEQIDALPGGSIAHKRIHGKLYYYHRTMVDGKRKEKFVDEAQMPVLKAQIEKRRKLIAELRVLQGKKAAPVRRAPQARTYAEPVYTDEGAENTDADAEDTEAEAVYAEPDPLSVPPVIPQAAVQAAVPAAVQVPYEYKLSVRTGEDLVKFAEPVKGTKKRECCRKLKDFLYGDADGKVLFLCGLRRTGKSTMMRQAIADMDEENLAKCAFMQATPKDGLHDLDADLRELERGGYKYVFIDEISSMPDFKEACSLIADSYAVCGMKLVLSGSSSLAFIICHDEVMYDRCLILDTTYIPYKDCAEVLGVKDLDQYMMHGGTMDLGHESEEGFVFADDASVGRYVDASIQKNIQDAMRFKGGRSGAYADADSAESAAGPVSSVVAQESRVFLKEILETEYKTGDLSYIPDNLLEILGAALHCDDVEMEHRREIEGHLARINYLRVTDTEFADPAHRTEYRVITTMPGIRYTQVRDMVETFIQDDMFASISATKRKNAQDKIMNEVSRHMMDDIIFIQTLIANPDKKVCRFGFDSGEYDLVIVDEKELTCKIFVIKHSEKTTQKQTRYLVDEDKLKETEKRFGKITQKSVIYRGKSGYIGDIRYINAEDYLMSL
ncbi:MAG: AAA family ATPase [Clostridia bacterium]|nr:AAA family ATPase [Clostridia bacterium]